MHSKRHKVTAVMTNTLINAVHLFLSQQDFALTPHALKPYLLSYLHLGDPGRVQNISMRCLLV